MPPTGARRRAAASRKRRRKKGHSRDSALAPELVGEGRGVEARRLASAAARDAQPVWSSSARAVALRGRAAGAAVRDGAVAGPIGDARLRRVCHDHRP